MNACLHESFVGCSNLAALDREDVEIYQTLPCQCKAKGSCLAEGIRCGHEQLCTTLHKTRVIDGIQARASPALQRVVDLQVERNGPALRNLLGDPDSLVRARAALALASVQNPDAGSALVPLLRDEAAGVRRDAAFALGQLTEPRFAPALLGALETEQDPTTRARILEAVGKLGDERALESLLSLDLPEQEEAARALAVSRMGIRGAVLPTGLNFLVTSLSTTDSALRLNIFSKMPWKRETRFYPGKKWMVES